MCASRENAGPAPRVSAEDAIMEHASRQHGVLTRAQLRAAGATEHVIDRLLKLRRLRPVHRGVYLVGPVVSPRAQEAAAVLACGGTGVISHGTAAAGWQIQPVRDETVSSR